MRTFANKYLHLTNTKALQLFQLFRQGFIILLAIYFAQSELSKEQVGNYEMLTYLAYLLTFFWVSGAIQALLALYPNLEKKSQSKLIFQGFSVFTLIIFAIIGIVVLFQDTFLLLLLQKGEVEFLLLFSVFLIGSIPASLQEYFYLLQQRPKALIVFGGATTLLQFLCLAIPIYLGLGMELAFLSLAILGLVKWLWTAGFTLKYGELSFESKILRDWWNLAWPLITYAFIAALNISVGPWFVGYFTGGDEAQFAVFRYGARELPLLTALAGALGSSIIPLIAADLTQGLADLKSKSAYLFHILFPVSIVLMLTSRWWFVWVFSVDFVDAIPVFNTFLLTVVAQMVFARTVLVGLHDTKLIPIIAVLSILVNILSCWVLGAYWGLLGIAIAIVITFIFEKIVLVAFLWKRHRISLFDYANVPLWAGYSIVLLLSYLFLI